MCDGDPTRRSTHSRSPHAGEPSGRRPTPRMHALQNRHRRASVALDGAWLAAHSSDVMTGEQTWRDLKIAPPHSDFYIFYVWWRTVAFSRVDATVQLDTARQLALRPAACATLRMAKVASRRSRLLCGRPAVRHALRGGHALRAWRAALHSDALPCLALPCLPLCLCQLVHNQLPDGATLLFSQERCACR